MYVYRTSIHPTRVYGRSSYTIIHYPLLHDGDMNRCTRKEILPGLYLYLSTQCKHQADIISLTACTLCRSLAQAVRADGI